VPLVATYAPSMPSGSPRAAGKTPGEPTGIKAWSSAEKGQGVKKEGNGPLPGPAGVGGGERFAVKRCGRQPGFRGQGNAPWRTGEFQGGKGRRRGAPRPIANGGRGPLNLDLVVAGGGFGKETVKINPAPPFRARVARGL